MIIIMIMTMMMIRMLMTIMLIRMIVTGVMTRVILKMMMIIKMKMITDHCPSPRFSLQPVTRSSKVRPENEIELDSVSK